MHADRSSRDVDNVQDAHVQEYIIIMFWRGGGGGEVTCTKVDMMHVHGPANRPKTSIWSGSKIHPI